MVSQSEFLDQLEGWVRELIVIAREDLASQTIPVLQRRPGDKRWNALECMAHVNAYADFYLPKFEQSVHKAKANKQTPGTEVKIGWLGSYCTKKMEPERRLKSKMKSPKQFNFVNRPLYADEIKKFITYQEIFLRIIAKSREININKPRIGFQPFPYLKMNLASFLQFLIMHQRRHMAQAQEAVGIHNSVS
jgi:uncharacterized damage-inducible protein DinB